MNINQLGLVDTLFRIAEKSPKGETDQMIAEFFLNNYKIIGNLNIYDVADQCFVSRSSVRRFCKQIGYDNFADMKADFKDFDYQYRYFMQLQEKQNYREWYEQEVIRTILELKETIDQSTLENIAKNIHDSENVVFLSSYSSAQYVKEFQRPLVLLNKVVYSFSDIESTLPILNTLNETDCIFVVSMMGNYARSSTELLSSVKCSKYLLTTSKDESLCNHFDEIYYLSLEDYSNVKSIQGKFGGMYFFDNLYNVYVNLYGK